MARALVVRHIVAAAAFEESGLFETLRANLRKRLRCASDRHRPERYGAREVDGVWQSHCLDCQRMIHRVDDVWRSLRKDNPSKHRRR